MATYTDLANSILVDISSRTVNREDKIEATMKVMCDNKMRQEQQAATFLEQTKGAELVETDRGYGKHRNMGD